MTINSRLDHTNLPLRIVLEGANNVRDLGGYATGNGRATRFGRLFRADALSSLTDRDVSTILERRIRTIIDLRDPEEVAAGPNHQAVLEAAEYHNIPLLSGLARGAIKSPPPSLGDFYVLGARYCTEQFRDVFTIIAAHTDGPLLFHCTAGKDRTGMVAALLLDLAGVAMETILEAKEQVRGWLLR